MQQIRGFHNTVGNTTVLQIGVQLEESCQKLVVEASKMKSKIHLLLNNDQYSFDKKHLEVGIIRLVGRIMLIFILRLARSRTFTAAFLLPY